MDDKEPIGDLNKVAISEFVPSVSDCAAIRDNYVILAARIIVENFTCFSSWKNCVPKHIVHEHSAVMKEKTVSVRICAYSLH